MKSYQASIKIKNIYSIIGVTDTDADANANEFDRDDVTRATIDKRVNES